MDMRDLHGRDVDHGDCISGVLDDLARHPADPWSEPFRDRVSRGVGFVTFAFDIDGVSMEIAKYARCFEQILPGVPIHCIAGGFADKADAVLDPTWNRFVLHGADGWDKWDGGKWFSKLFYEDLPAESELSSELAREMWHQGLDLADRLVGYLEDQQVGLVVPVNTNSNPGNVALALALVLATESLGCAVINNNHDFYWEGGKEGCKRGIEEPRGPRDHFFRNHDNEEFFSFFQRIFPWNGRRWVQVDINPVQERKMIDRYHFRPDDVFTIGTGLESAFFEPATPQRRLESRQKLAMVLGGDPVIDPTPLAEFQERVDVWLKEQTPIVCSGSGTRQLDLCDPETLYLLQPTRVVDRKRIWRDWELLALLLRHKPFRTALEQRPGLTLMLHVTGPVPIEHRECLERVLQSFQMAVEQVPGSIAERLFLAFSVGCQTSPDFDGELGIVDIYQAADLVMFPSLTEGRGLPIPESAAAGVPIVASPYEPRAVFDEVVGAGLDPDDQVHYIAFPEEAVGRQTLDELTRGLLEPDSLADTIEHNRAVVRDRFSLDALTSSFDEILDRLEVTVSGD